MDVVDCAARDPLVELEVRLGNHDHNGHFTAGITSQMYDAILDTLNGFAHWKETQETSRHDFCYDEPEFVRLSASPDFADGPVAIQKKKLKSQCTTVHVVNASPLSVRIVASSEIPFENLSALDMHLPRTVRVKETRRWVTTSGVSYELSRVWSASTLNQANQMRHESEGTYEFEIEILNREYFQKGSQYVLESLMMKITDVVQFATLATLATQRSSTARASC